MENLKSFVEGNINYEKDHMFYNESFCNLVFDYLGSMGCEITKQDEEYLKVNGYSIEDFKEDENAFSLV